MSYVVDYTDGRRSLCETYDAAVAVCRAEWPAAVVGHSGDLQDGGDRTLVWACEADSIEDAGQRAVAEIRRV